MTAPVFQGGTDAVTGTLGVVGSGRSAGASARLLTEALAGAAGGSRAPGTTIHLAHLTFRGCIGCRACRTTAQGCVLRDDLTSVLETTARADALILASPIYYAYVTGLCKSYLDRWYCFRDGAGGLRVPSGRPALLLLTQGNPNPAAYDSVRQNLEKVLSAYGFRPTTLVASGLAPAEDAPLEPRLIDRARHLGSTLRSA